MKRLIRAVYTVESLLLLLACCCSFESRSPSREGETHWLMSCKEGTKCGENGTCICGVCTTACQQDSDCKNHDKAAVCANSVTTALADGCSGEDISLTTDLCILPCESSADCSIDKNELVCASDLCVAADHDLAKQKPGDVCPENPDFQCKGVTPSEMGVEASALDENGCLLRSCFKDADCLTAESCFISESADTSNCFLPQWSCTDSGTGCECADVDMARRDVCDYGYCLTPNPIVLCPEKIESDQIDILDSYIEGDRVTISVGHGGGCSEHSYELCYTEAFAESYPVQTTLKLIHDAGDDKCEMYVLKDLNFDLSPLKEMYKDAYRTESGIISTPFGLYGFGPISCDERTMVASERVGQAVAKADTSCSTDTDCVLASNSIADCYYSCGSIVSQGGQDYLENRLRIIEANICGNVDEEGCFVPIPPCIGFEPLSCVDGECVSVQDTNLN